MKILLCALLMAFSVCFAEVCDTTSSSGIFKVICSLDAKEKSLEKSVDSLKNAPNEAFKETREYYNEAFKDIQSAYEGFLAFLSIIIAVAVGLSVLFNHLQRKDARDFSEKTINELREDMEKSKIESKENMEKLKKEFKEDMEKLKIESEEDMKKQQSEMEKIQEKFNEYRSDMFRSIARNYLKQAGKELENKNLEIHYSKLYEYFDIFVENKIELKNEDSKDFETIASFIAKYEIPTSMDSIDKHNDFWKYVHMFNKFKENYEQFNKNPKVFEEIEKTHNTLYSALYKSLSKKYVNDRLAGKEWEQEDIC